MKCIHLLFLGVLLVADVNAGSGYSVADPAFDGNDYATINQGQLKNVAIYWSREMALSDISVSSDILDIVNGFTQSGNNAVVNLGQLKTVAKPFYDHLLGMAPDALPSGFEGTYPWSNPASPPNDYAVANIGQVKYLFNFDLSAYQSGSAITNISGLVTYFGSQSGKIHIIASLDKYDWSQLFSQSLEQPGAFSVDVRSGTNYWLKAFMDVDGNGIGNGSEPFAVYPLPVDAGNGSIALTLQGATGNQWQQLNYFGVLSSGIDLNADEDGDTISNGDEFQNGTDWRNMDSDGDGLADNLESNTNPLNSDSNGNGLGDGSEKALNDSLAANPYGSGVLVNVPGEGFYHAAETNLDLVYLGGQ